MTHPPQSRPTTEPERPDRAERQQALGDGSRTDPYRWGRIVALRFCRCKGLHAAHIIEEAQSVANLAIALAMPKWDSSQGSLSGFVAMVVERRLKHWIRKESKWATQRLPLIWESSDAEDEPIEQAAPSVDLDVPLVAAEIRGRLREIQNRSDAELIDAFLFSNDGNAEVAKKCCVSRQHLWRVLRRNRPHLIAILGRE